MKSAGTRPFVTNRLVRCAATVALILAAQGIGGCRTQVIQEKEDSLAAAGFILRPANTPERIAMLKRLPPNRFVKRVHGDEVHYVYADPIVCNCLYVGNQKAYGAYKQEVFTRNIVNEQQLNAEIYQDNWEWGGWDWGPWGPGPGW